MMTSPFRAPLGNDAGEERSEGAGHAEELGRTVRDARRHCQSREREELARVRARHDLEQPRHDLCPRPMLEINDPVDVSASGAGRHQYWPTAAVRC